jgi:alpha-L-fucosidase
MLNEHEARPFTAEDVRFTRKGDALYAIFLDWPSGESAIASLGSKALSDSVIERIDLVGGPELPFRREAERLRVSIPQSRPGDFVPVLRIKGRGLA